MNRVEVPKTEAVEHTVEAEYPTMEGATQAMSALEWAGIEAVNVNLAGPAVEEAFYKRDTQQRDTRVARDMVKRAGGGALISIIVLGFAGGIAGLIVGRASGLSAYDAWLTCGLGALLGGLIGGFVGAMVGGEVALNMNEASEFKYDDSEEGMPAIVRVHVRDEKMAQRAATILQAKHPRTMQCLADGRPAEWAP
jgi:hypothetical protein